MKNIKEMIKKIMRFSEKWLINQNFLRKFRHFRFPKLQKFWFGKPELPCPLNEKKYFDALNLTSHIVCRSDEYRAAGSVEKKVVLTLDHCGEAEQIDMAVSPVSSSVFAKEAEVFFVIDAQQTKVSNVPHDVWTDIRLPKKSGTIKLEVRGNVPFFITKPLAVIKNKKENGNIPRHVLVLVLDAWTADFFGKKHPFISGKTCTPNIDKFFCSGFKAEHGFSNGQWTLPAVGSLFSGLHVAKHKMSHPRKWQEFSKDQKLLTEYFQEKGYHTFCGSSVSRVSPAFGHSRGVDRFMYHSVDKGISYKDYDPAKWIQEIISHLEVYHSDKTFNYFQFPDTHPNWDSAPITRYFNLGMKGNIDYNFKKYFTNESDNVKDQCLHVYSTRIAEIDRMLGSIFNYVQENFQEEALVILTADHGMRMPYLPHENRKDKPFLTNARMNIPLFIRGAGVCEEAFEKNCSPNIDLPAILYDLCGIEDHGAIDGVNILKDPDFREIIISEYMYKGIYEIALRGYSHVMFLKYKANDMDFVLEEEEPFYKALYEESETCYSQENNLFYSKKDISEKIMTHAVKHLKGSKLIRGNKNDK